MQIRNFIHFYMYRNYSDKGSFPNLFNPSVPFFQKRIISIIAPTIGINANNKNHADLSISCKRLDEAVKHGIPNTI